MHPLSIPLFLKTQEDIDELLRKYPIGDYTIEIREWERINFESSIEIWSMRINDINEFTIITSWEDFILEKGDMIRYPALIKWGIVPKFPKNRYRYNADWIEVMVILKELSHNEKCKSFPIHINKILIPENKHWEMIKLYEMIEKFSIFIQERRRQFLLFRSIKLDDKEQNNQVFIIFNWYYFQSFATYFGILIRNSLDGWNRASLRRILNKWLKIWLLNKPQYTEYKTEIEKFDNVLKELNNRITHLDGKAFLKNHSIQRTAQTTASISISTINPVYISQNVDLIFDLTYKILLKEFWITIWNPKTTLFPKNYTLTLNQD